MHLYADRFYAFLARPIPTAGRIALAVFVIPLLASFTQPLWRISMDAPQYPEGLQLDIYAYKVEGGNGGQHLQEINTLNHYIGMHALDREALSDLDWIPFALGGLAIFALRVAAIGTVSGLVDLFVATAYVSLFAFGRFVYTLYVFGHNLNPEAPVKVPGFMPAVIGSKQIANFTTHSWPHLGSGLLALFVLGVGLVLGWQLLAGRRAAVRAHAGSGAGAELERRATGASSAQP
jgi:copper chaperone NosL